MAAKKRAPAAKRGASRYQAPAKQPVPGWIWLACGLLVGGFVVFLMQLKPGQDSIQRSKIEHPATTKVVPKELPAKAAPQKPKYDFYTLLPESQVLVPPDAITAPPIAPKPLSAEQAAILDASRAQALLDGETPPEASLVAKAPTSNAFFLQAGSFRKREDADKLRAQIILLGQSVQIESGTVREEVWHRVLVGPFANREQLGKAQKSMAANGFGNLLLQQRQSP